MLNAAAFSRGLDAYWMSRGRAVINHAGARACGAGEGLENGESARAKVVLNGGCTSRNDVKVLWKRQVGREASKEMHFAF